MHEAPSITQTPTPKDPKNALKNAPSRHVYSDNIKHQNMQQYALQLSRSRMQARNLAPETNSGPDSAQRPAKPPPPQSSPPPYNAIRAIASNQKTNKATKKASFDLRNNNRMLVAACGAFPLSPLPFSPFLCFIDNKQHACLRRVSSLPTALFPCPLLHC